VKHTTTLSTIGNAIASWSNNVTASNEARKALLVKCAALKLPEKQRIAVSLQYLAGKAPEDIATILGTSRDNAYKLVTRGDVQRLTAGAIRRFIETVAGIPQGAVDANTPILGTPYHARDIALNTT
jgi:hypothetical protein